MVRHADPDRCSCTRRYRAMDDAVRGGCWALRPDAWFFDDPGTEDRSEAGSLRPDGERTFLCWRYFARRIRRRFLDTLACCFAGISPLWHWPKADRNSDHPCSRLLLHLRGHIYERNHRRISCAPDLRKLRFYTGRDLGKRRHGPSTFHPGAAEGFTSLIVPQLTGFINRSPLREPRKTVSCTDYLFETSRE